MRRRRHKVVLRRSHSAYRWRTWSESLGRFFRFLVFVGSAVGMAWGAHRLWTTAPGFTVTAIETTGAVPPGFEKSIPLRVGQPLWTFKTQAVEQELLRRFPTLGEVRVRRTWRRAVRVTSAPRRAVARRLDNDRWVGLDRTGRAFPLPDTGPGLLLMTGATDPVPTARALAWAETLRNTKEPWTERLYKIKMSTDGDLLLFLGGDTRVYWGAADLSKDVLAPKARRLSKVFDAPEGAAGYDALRFVDDRRVVARPHTPDERHPTSP